MLHDVGGKGMLHEWEVGLMVNLAESYKKEHCVISINLVMPMGFLQTLIRTYVNSEIYTIPRIWLPLSFPGNIQ